MKLKKDELKIFYSGGLDTTLEDALRTTLLDQGYSFLGEWDGSDDRV